MARREMPLPRLLKCAEPDPAASLSNLLLIRHTGSVGGERPEPIPFQSRLFAKYGSTYRSRAHTKNRRKAYSMRIPQAVFVATALSFSLGTSAAQAPASGPSTSPTTPPPAAAR